MAAGIENADMERIFNAFESRKGNRGTGLGLRVSRKIPRASTAGTFAWKARSARGSRYRVGTLRRPAQQARKAGATLFDLPPRF
jgi:K+-sensing histidine kinase KdpD